MSGAVLNVPEDKVEKVIHEQIDYAFVKVKLWIVSSVLANVLLLGLPGLLFVWNFAGQATAIESTASDNSARLDQRQSIIMETSRNVDSVQEYLEKNTTYKRPTKPRNFE